MKMDEWGDKQRRLQMTLQGAERQREEHSPFVTVLYLFFLLVLVCVCIASFDNSEGTNGFNAVMKGIGALFKLL